MSTKKTRPSIPIDVKTRLWTFSGGRCEFEGCNKALWQNGLTMHQMNTSYIAHIYAYSPNGSRYDKVLSPQLEIAYSNLMLMCDECHRLIDDKSRENEYPASRLLKMKKDHEDRIELLTSIKPDKRSHILLYGAKVGQHNAPLHFERAITAILPAFYPSMPNAVEIGLKNSSFEDSGESFWAIEVENLVKQFIQKVGVLKDNHEVQHFSIFGLAPQPLLVKLGTLLSDMFPAEVYQLHREPSTWSWQEESKVVNHSIKESTGRGKRVALKFELSATIADVRVTDVLGDDCEIWSITHPSPNNDYLKSKAYLKDFRVTMRKTFDSIKAKHGQDAELHIFPAMPVSAAIELGRVWMPKADLPLKIYEQNWKKGGFFKALEITN